jgi:uncharacterized protein YbcC (UPF0753/DUF2309 family)
MIQQSIKNSISKASQVIGKTWPLYSFVTSNPLSGYEKMSFKEAGKHAKEILGAKVFPEASVYRQAWEQGEIDENELLGLLKDNQMFESPEYYLNQMEGLKGTHDENKSHDLDRIMAKWLAAFMDEGLAEWEMPNKSEGFYKSWRALAKYDNELSVESINDIPKTNQEALGIALNDYVEEAYTAIFTHHLAALPGWTGYINYRTESNSLWQQEYPITLEDYLAVRLWIAKSIKAEILPQEDVVKTSISLSKLQYIWLKAWEKSWQNELHEICYSQSITTELLGESELNPDAQMVFCIDTRSELIRRHVESKGAYETFGYAGFFGIAMDYEHLGDGLIRKSCPPIVGSAYKVIEKPQENEKQNFIAFEKKNELVSFSKYFLKRMKNMLPSAFGYVEGTGVFYGLAMVMKTLIPGYSYRINKKNTLVHESICETHIEHNGASGHAEDGIPLEEKVAIVKSGFDLMGWKTFAPLVLFIGHGSHSANNPFGSSLDCGACAASPGRHNARMLAKLANMADVREVLKESHNISIPQDTVFIGGEHNTTTDEIILFDSQVPDSHFKLLQNLKQDLLKAQQTATHERLGKAKKSVSFAELKANNWGETRPEWGLAKNAGFIVGSRKLTKNSHLDGRCFLHSYDWEMDKKGKALEGIMQGPMVVTQWINNHYYFSTVDNDVFGGGSKITHNITGKFGVVQGNGGDLKMGLPLQSVNESDHGMYHQPLRLSVLIHAPLDRVYDILSRNENLKNLLDNEWIYLMIMDPTEKNKITRYQSNMNISLTEKKLSLVID